MEFGADYESPDDARCPEAARAAVAVAEDDLVPCGGGELEIHVREFERQIGTVTIRMDIKKNTT